MSTPTPQQTPSTEHLSDTSSFEETQPTPLVSSAPKKSSMKGLLIGSVLTLLTGGVLLGLQQFNKPNAEEILANTPTTELVDPIAKEKSAFATNPQLQGMFAGTVRQYQTRITDQAVTERLIHSKQFRNTTFIKKHRSAWTIELLRAYDERVITAILDKVEKPELFNYFRYAKKNLAGEEQEFFVLTAGQFKTKNEAQQMLVSFKGFIPSIIPVVNTFSQYEKYVSDRSGDEIFTAGVSQVKEVKLKLVYDRPYQAPIEVLQPTLADFVKKPYEPTNSTPSNTNEQNKSSSSGYSQYSSASEKLKDPFDDMSQSKPKKQDKEPEIKIEPLPQAE